MATIAKLTSRHSSSISSHLLKHFANFSSTITKPPTTPLTTKPLIPLKPHNHKPLFPKLFCTNANQSGSENSDSDNEENPKTTNRDNHKPNLPPPYDPFNKKPAIQEPKDPKNLPEIFHNIRHGDGLMNFAVKMFDGLSKDGLTHEALELFAQIKDGGNMPDVVAHTAVVEAYVNAGKAKEALRAFVRMQACGVRPNAYGYGVVIKGLVGCGDGKMFKEGRKCVVEMLGKGMRVNGGVCVAVFEAFVRMGMVEEGREFLEVMKGKGFVVDEKEVREVLKGKRGVEFRGVMDILFGK